MRAVIRTCAQGGTDVGAGVLRHADAEYRFPALPPEVLAILEDGGLIPHVKRVLAGA